MQLLPLVDPASGSVGLVPVCDTSAILLARMLLESHTAKPDPGHLLSELKSQLSDDPPLAVWALACAQARGGETSDLSSTVQWLWQNARALVAALRLRDGTRPGESSIEPACVASAEGSQGGESVGPKRLPLLVGYFPADQVHRLADLVAHRVAVAELAARLATEKFPSQPELVERARLAGLVMSPGDWNLGPEAGHDLGLRIPDGAEPFVVDALARLGRQGLSCPSPGGQALPCRAVEARTRWLASVPGAGGLLPALADRLADLDKLQQIERDLSVRLETEKLEALAEFAAGAGHEINNPLANISGRAQMLLRSEADLERRRELATIVAQAQRAHQMIADLWLFARPPQPEFRRIDMLEVADRAVAELSPWAAERQIELVRTGRTESLWIRADPVQLQVAIGALVTNAVEAMGSGGRIEVAVECRGPEAAIRVRDNGPGIPAEHRPHLFDPFFSGRQAGRGLGLGLSKAWQIARNHRGRIEVADVPRGASLAMVLPADTQGGTEEP